MPKLTDTQLVILSAAARRKDAAALPLPKSLMLRGGAVTRVLESLVKKGLLTEKLAARGAAAWREAEDGQRMMLVAAEAGLQAIGAEPDSGPGQPAAETKPRPKTRVGAAKPKKAKRSKRAGRKPAASKAKGKESPPTVRQGTKQALLIDLLKRKRGATIDEIAQAADWQAHSVRGAISGALKKKLGLAVTSEKVEGRGRVYRIGEHG
jgi:predicted ArsR family transcriptional regulator